MHAIEAWLHRYVNEPRFAVKLESLIEGLDDAAQLRVRLSLMDYLVPKVKGIDPAGETQDKEISINFEVAK